MRFSGRAISTGEWSLSFADRAGVAAQAAKLWTRTLSVPEALALACLASLFLRYDRYPVVVEVSTAQVRLQDLLFAGAVASALSQWKHINRGQVVGALTFVPLLALVFLSGLRSADGATAVIAVLKFAEFLIGGFAAMWLISAGRRPELATGVLVAGTLANAAYAFGVLVVDGGASALLTGRADGLVGTEAYAPAAAATIVWCYARLNSAWRDSERLCCAVGFAAGALAFVTSKSLIAVVCAVAILLLAPALERRWLRATALGAACLVLVLALGRGADVAGLLGSVDVARPAVVLGPVPNGKVLPGRVESSLGSMKTPPEKFSRGSLVHRIALGYLGVRLSQDQPLLGHGWLRTSDADFLTNGSRDVVMLERFPRLDPALLVSNNPTQSHNAYVQVAAEAGLLAVVALLLVLVYASVRSSREVWARHTSSTWSSIVALGWVTIISLYLATTSLFGGSFEAFLLGGTVALASQGSAPPLRARHVTGTVAVFAGGLIGMLLVLFPTFGRAQAAPRVPVEVSDTAAKTPVYSVDHKFDGPEAATVQNSLLTVRMRHGDLLLNSPGLGSGRGTLGRVTLGPGFNGPRVSVRLVQRRASQVTLAYRPIRVDADSVYVTVVRDVPGVYVLTKREGSRRGRRIGFRRPQEGAMLHLGNAAYSIPKDPLPRSWKLRMGLPVSLLADGSNAIGVVIPYTEARATAFGNVGGKAPNGLFVRHPARTNSVTFFGLAGAPWAGGYRPDLRLFSLAVPGTYTVLRRLGNGWRESDLSVRSGYARTASGTAIVPRLLDGRYVGVDEVAEMAGTACPTLQSLSRYPGRVQKDSKGNPIIKTTGCTAYAGNPKLSLPLHP